MNEKTWTDQPDVVAKYTIVAKFNLPEARHVEARRAEGGAYYVTFGNLFGSQTVRVSHCEDILILCQKVCDRESRRGRDAMELPPGCTVITR